MMRLVTLELWSQVSRLAEKAKCRMAAVAYVTRAAELRFRAGDVLIVDASDQAIKSGATAAAILRAAHRRRARLFNCPGLHTKVLLLDDVAVVGSANISATSVNRKIEAALITDDRSIAKNVRSLIIQLAHQAQEIDEQFLRRIGKIKVSRKRPESSRAAGVRSERALARHQGKDEAPPDIVPIVLEGPPMPRPPDSLKAIHMNDWLRYVIAAEEAAKPPP